MIPRASAAAAALVSGALLCCGLGGKQSHSDWVYQPDRRDYAAFRAAHPNQLDEPNYLPFMVHVLPGDDVQGDYLVLCRWPDEAMPLKVYVAPTKIAEALQDEFRPRAPEGYEQAVERALETWESELEGFVRFRRVDDAKRAALVLRLVAEEAPEPEPDLRVLGTTPIGHACRARGLDPDAERLEVSFEVPEVRIYLADRYGLLDPDQVEWIARHEIGHALGMRGHSPIPADLMYEVVRDRVSVQELSDEDVNSFVSLYRLPNGTIFRRVRPGERQPRPPPMAPTGPPMLTMAPHVDARHGFEIRLPAGWMRLDIAQGVVAVDGVTWDYTSSLQVLVHNYPSIEAYLERYGDAYLQHGSLVRRAFIVVGGRRALQVEIRGPDGEFAEELTFIETGDGRLVLVIADSPYAAFESYRLWFRAALASLEIWPASEAAPRVRN